MLTIILPDKPTYNRTIIIGSQTIVLEDKEIIMIIRDLFLAIACTTSIEVYLKGFEGRQRVGFDMDLVKGRHIINMDAKLVKISVRVVNFSAITTTAA